MSHNYTGFDLYVFNLWLNEYLKSPDFLEKDKNISLDDKISKEHIMENSRLPFDIVYGLIHDDIFPLLGILAPMQYNKMELSGAYIDFSHKIQRELNLMVDLSGIFGRGHKQDLSSLLDDNQQPQILFSTFF